MTDPDEAGALAENRLAGEDAPIWVTLGFAAVGTFVAGAAAWLALSAQPTALEPTRVDLAPEHAASSAKPQASGDNAASAADRAPPSEPGSPKAKAGGDASTGADPPSGAPVPDSSRPSAEGAGQPLPRDEARLARSEACPPPIEIPFNLESARPITKDVQMALTRLQTFLDRHPDARVSIEGHADSSGAEEYNLLLSYRRAKAVVAVLENSGLSEKRMTVRAAGDSTPIEGLPRRSAKNRRVVLEVVGVESCQDAAGASSR